MSKQTIYAKYRDNFARHVLDVTHHLEAGVMGRLIDSGDYVGLRINWEPFIGIAATGEGRLSDIAKRMGMSRQAVNQTVNQIEQAGYLKRVEDPSSKRSKLLQLTEFGRAMLRDGALQADRVEEEMAEIVGSEELLKVKRAVLQLSEELGLQTYFKITGEDQALLPTLMPRLAEYTKARLRELNVAKGYPRLKAGAGLVLIALGPKGGRIQKIADKNGMTKQAISAVAIELEELGYIRREPDPQDPRQLLLFFTPEGEAMIEDSVESVHTLEDELASLVGKKAFQAIKNCLKDLCDTFAEESGEDRSDQELNEISEQLLKQLGDKKFKALARAMAVKADKL
ncbi:MAG: MarR family transcriptional regulator [Pseudomonadales bacterium]|nr:MarR family transcriptional regulator [Pseudomonadales bacterium]